MQFKKEIKEHILDKVVELLKRSVGDNSFLTLYILPNVDALMKRQHAVCSLENNDELNKRFDKSFTDTITRSGLKDKFEDLDKFLLSINNALNETFRRMEEEAYAWLNGYLCDDKDCWCHCAIFMGFAAQFGKIVESFFKKFTNTRMHGKHVLGVDGERIFHDLYKFSPIASSTFEMDLFTIDDYGENYERINEKYKKVIQLISNIYAFSVYIDNKAKQIAADGEKSKQCLIDFLTPFREERSKSFNGNFRIYPDEIENAKSKFSTKIVEEIDTLNLSELSKKYYHEVDSLHGVSFAILMWVRILRQQGMTDVEYEEVFKHIEDPYVRKQKALETKILLEHMPELSKSMLTCCSPKSIKKQFDKGKLVRLVYEWTGTIMSEAAFVKYYNATLSNKEFEVTRSTLNSAKNYAKADGVMQNNFNKEASLIIKKYKLDDSYMIATGLDMLPEVFSQSVASISGRDVSNQQNPAQSNQMPYTLVAKQKTHTNSAKMALKY